VDNRYRPPPRDHFVDGPGDRLPRSGRSSPRIFRNFPSAGRTRGRGDASRTQRGASRAGSARKRDAGTSGTTCAVRSQELPSLGRLQASGVGGKKRRAHALLSHF